MGGRKNFAILLMLMLAGVVIGGFVGEYLETLPYMGWIGYGNTFGLTSPLVLDLGVIAISFALTIKFSIAGIIGIAVAGLIYSRI